MIICCDWATFGSFICCSRVSIIWIWSNMMLTVNILTFSSLLLLCTIPWTTLCTSLLFTLLFIKSQYTVFLFLYILLFLHILLFFAHLFCTSYCLLHILLSFAHLIVFCTSYCLLHILLFFAHLIVLHFFYFIAHFTLISPFLTICMPLCYVTLYNLYSYCFALSTERTWFDYISLLIIPCITIMWQIKQPWPWPWCSVTKHTFCHRFTGKLLNASFDKGTTYFLNKKGNNAK